MIPERTFSLVIITRSDESLTIRSSIGRKRLLNVIVNLCPSPIERGPEHAICTIDETKSLIQPNPEGPTIAFIFKTMSEPRVGEIS